tara:strand:+ start:414 stop:698 length:285 start_codon:yes stop_codon:yes gene_type:complete
MAFKMYGKTPMMKRLIGKQHNLPEHLQAKIESSPATQKQDNNNLEMKRQNKIADIDSKLETLEERRFNEEITQEQYNKAIKALRVEEKQVKKPL